MKKWLRVASGSTIFGSGFRVIGYRVVNFSIYVLFLAQNINFEAKIAFFIEKIGYKYVKMGLHSRIVHSFTINSLDFWSKKFFRVPAGNSFSFGSVSGITRC